MNKFDEANECLKGKELDKAKVLLEELLHEEPDHADALYNLGMTYTELGTPRKAVKTLSKLSEYRYRQEISIRAFADINLQQKRHSNGFQILLFYIYGKLGIENFK